MKNKSPVTCGLFDYDAMYETTLIVSLRYNIALLWFSNTYLIIFISLAANDTGIN